MGPLLAKRLPIGISYRCWIKAEMRIGASLLDILQPAWHGLSKLFSRRAAMRALLFVAPTQHVPRLL